MPGPLMKSPDTKSSVFDSPIMKGLKAVGSFLGADDPNSQLMSSVQPMPLVSIYKNAAERALGTKAAIESAYKVHQNLGKAVEWLASQKPRVAAHMRFAPIEATEGVQASTHIPLGKVKEPITIGISRSGQGTSTVPGEVRDVVGEEATHVAQALGNSDLSSLYGNALELAGYEGNPLEITAKQRGLSSYFNKKKAIPINRTATKFTPEVKQANRNLIQAQEQRWIENPVIDYDDPVIMANVQAHDEKIAALKRVLANTRSRAPQEKYTALRGLRELTLDPPTNKWDSAAAEEIRNILSKRGVLK
jgi:hypothetical protein